MKFFIKRFALLSSRSIIMITLAAGILMYSYIYNYTGSMYEDHIVYNLSINFIILMALFNMIKLMISMYAIYSKVEVITSLDRTFYEQFSSTYILEGFMDVSNNFTSSPNKGKELEYFQEFNIAMQNVMKERMKNER